MKISKQQTQPTPELNGTKPVEKAQTPRVRGSDEPPPGPFQALGKATTISLPGQESGIYADLQAGVDAARELYRSRPTAKIASEIQQRSYPRKALTKLLRQQNEARGASSKVLANIDRLEDPKTVTVVTGQQVGLMGGPLYSLFKALGVVHRADELTRQGIDAVPVFWMATYDHDFPEVNRVEVAGSGHDAVKMQLKSPRSGDLQPVGDVALGKDVHAFLDQLESELGSAPHKGELMGMLRSIYTPEETYGGAFSKLIGALTDRFGLIILDPNRREFQALATPVLEKELFGDPSAGPIQKATSQLEQMGHAPQIVPREERLNLFFIDDQGQRVSLSKVDGGFETGGTPAFLSTDDARALLREAPERFSPSALLRPIVEDAVLPTIGYVGGPAERKYYAQSIGLYDWAGLPAPEVLKRPSFGVVSAPKLKALTEATGLGIVALLQDENPHETIGRALIPERVRTSYDKLAQHAAALEELAQSAPDLVNQGATSLLNKKLDALALGIRGEFRKARSAVNEAGLGRLAKGLEATLKSVDRGFTLLKKQLETSDPKSGHSPSFMGFGVVAKALTQLDRQLAKVGRQQRPDIMEIFHQLKPSGRLAQERVMSIGQLVAEHGTDVVGLIAQKANVHQSGPELVIVESGQK